MKNLIALVGLPGSGKTYWARQLSKKTSKSVVFDDSYTLGEVLVHAENGHTPIVCDSNLCQQKAREKFQTWADNNGLETVWIYFENSPEKCCKNLTTRAASADFFKLVNWYSSWYSIPEGAATYPVWDDSGSSAKKNLPKIRR